MNVLVAGGAGYIGSHAVKQLVEGGHHVVAVDNLFRGHKGGVDARADFVEADLADTDVLSKTLEEHRVECVMHFAAMAYVGESVNEPLRYYDKNTAGTISLLKAMRATGVKRMVFSSTCATYGQPEKMPIVESTKQEPINPYGWSKLFVERMLRDIGAGDREFGFVALRYFNVAGCAADGSIGEDHEPETHLIPVLLQTAMGKRESVTVFGDDYPTEDGTCIRDYLHVEDLCAAHILCMKRLQSGDGKFYNLGIGRGHSVRQVIESVKRVTGRDIKIVIGKRRAGDPPTLYANADLIARELGWKPKFTELDEIVKTAWNWFSKHPEGYSQ